MSYNDKASRFQSWLHRTGWSQRQGGTYSTGRWTRVVVQTRLPWLLLARQATRYDVPRPLAVQRVSRWTWRWTFGPKL